MKKIKKLLKKYQLKKIAYHAFYSDECDNLNAFHKKDLLNETGGIFDMIIYDLKLIQQHKAKGIALNQWLEKEHPDILHKYKLLINHEL